MFKIKAGLMISLDLLDDSAFDAGITYDWVRSFMSRLMTYLLTHPPPSHGHYSRSPTHRFPGLTIKLDIYVSVHVQLEFT